jgi:hypothetical protein
LKRNFECHKKRASEELPEALEIPQRMTRVT